MLLKKVERSKQEEELDSKVQKRITKKVQTHCAKMIKLFWEEVTLVEDTDVCVIMVSAVADVNLQDSCFKC